MHCVVINNMEVLTQHSSDNQQIGYMYMYVYILSACLADGYWFSLLLEPRWQTELDRFTV